MILTTDSANQPLARIRVASKALLSLSTKNFSSDQRTRLVLLIANLIWYRGRHITRHRTARDGQSNLVTLTVESVRRVPGFDWVTQVVVKLPDELANLNQVQLSVTARGRTSNEVPIQIVSGGG